MRESQRRVHPQMPRIAQLIQVELARRQQHLPQISVDRVPVDIGIGVGVRTQRLALAQRIVKRAPIPQAHVIEHRTILREIDAPFFLR